MVIKIINRLKNKLLFLNPKLIYKKTLEARLRKKYDFFLREFPFPQHQGLIHGTVLVDCTYNNPNFWVRYKILCSALGIKASQVVGLVGRWHIKPMTMTLKRFGVKRILTFPQSTLNSTNLKSAEALYANIKTADDFMSLKLPLDIPPDFLYDYILKIQCTSMIDVTDPNLKKYITEFLDIFTETKNILNEIKPGLLVISQPVGWYAPLIWTAIKNNVRVIVLTGNFGLARFWKCYKAEEIYEFPDRPTFEDLQKMTSVQKNNLEAAGKDHFSKRMKGSLDILAIRYAYEMRKTQVNKQMIKSKFGWHENKKIIGVYSQNWFDFPHSYGMRNFRDFHEWIIETLNIAQETKDFYWLFKGHPVDAWYQGIALEDIIKSKLGGHVQLCERDWNSADLIHSIDAFVTCHGSIGIEATALGKPVLTADRGWYHDWNFTRSTQAKEEYLDLLRTAWWEGMDLKSNQRLANIFAGAYWTRPAWQKDFVFEDDCEKGRLYKELPNILIKNQSAVEKEISELREWFLSEIPTYPSRLDHFHTFKMMRVNEYTA